MMEEQAQAKVSAQAIWRNMSESERFGVRFGMFPADKMRGAELCGVDGKLLAIALMDIASKNGGMRP